MTTFYSGNDKKLKYEDFMELADTQNPCFWDVFANIFMPSLGFPYFNYRCFIHSSNVPSYACASVSFFFSDNHSVVYPNDYGKITILKSCGLWESLYCIDNNTTMSESKKERFGELVSDFEKQTVSDLIFIEEKSVFIDEYDRFSLSGKNRFLLSVNKDGSVETMQSKYFRDLRKMRIDNIMFSANRFT